MIQKKLIKSIALKSLDLFEKKIFSFKKNIFGLKKRYFSKRIEEEEEEKEMSIEEKLKDFELRLKEIENHSNLEEKNSHKIGEGSLYCAHFDRSCRISELVEKWDDKLKTGERTTEEVKVSGRVMSKRQSGKKLVFYTIDDSSGKTLQILFSQSNFDQFSFFDEEGNDKAENFSYRNRLIRKGDIIGVKGIVGKSERGEFSVVASQIFLLSPCFHDLPKKLRDPEIRHRNRHLDFLVNPSLKDIFEKRASIIKFIRFYFHSTLLF